jgi:streptogramin lyase
MEEVGFSRKKGNSNLKIHLYFASSKRLPLPTLYYPQMKKLSALVLRLRTKLVSVVVLAALIASMVGVSSASADSTILGTTGSYPIEIAIDSIGNIYTTNLIGRNVSKITPAGVSTILGTTGSDPRSLTFDSDGNIYTANYGSNNVSKITPAGASSILGTTGSRPIGMTIDSAGNIYTANYSSNNVSKITPAGASSILGTTGSSPYAITIDSAGNIYTANYDSNNVSKITPAGASSILGTTGSNPHGITIDSAGNIYTANIGSDNISKITSLTAPGAPTIGTATALLPTSASISFTAPASDGGATIETYTATSTPGSITSRVLQSGSGSITITGLTPSTAYTFRVTASNSVGTSSASGATVSITMPASQSEIDAAAVATQKAAEAKREAEKQAARNEILNLVKTYKDINLELFIKAEIYGVTSANIAVVQAEISALPQTSRADLSQVLKIARKYEVVGKIASDQFASVYSDNLIEIGLIPQGSKYKAALTAAIRKLSQSDRSSYASIKQAIDVEMADIQARKDRLAKAIARNASRYLK